MYENDNRIVLTLDAGGTNFVFSAICGNQIVTPAITTNAHPENLDVCLKLLKDSFMELMQNLPSKPVAISFAFPGPADYKNGVIGNLPNFPAFRGGIALGPYLQKEFGLPVYINNDGNLYAYGEAVAGLLPQTNKLLNEKGCSRQYKNLIGVTLGTGFGAGIVLNNELLFGDNGCGGDTWILRNKSYPSLIAEESVSIRAIKRVYCELANDANATKLEPVDIFYVAEGKAVGDRRAAIMSFEKLGEVLGDCLSQIATFGDGLISIGGGLSGASKYIFPTMLTEIRSSLGTFAGDSFPRMQSEVFDLDAPDDLNNFLKEKKSTVLIPNTDIHVPYLSEKKIGIGVSRLGTNRAVQLGAYAFALQQLDK